MNRIINSERRSQRSRRATQLALGVCTLTVAVACGSTQLRSEATPTSSQAPREEVAAVSYAGNASDVRAKRSMASQAAEPHGWDGLGAQPEMEDEMVRVAPPVPTAEANTESYDAIVENGFVSVQTAPLSTFSVDVDTASYSNVRRMIDGGKRPPTGAVRIEELINYFDYEYEPPTSDRPFSVYTEVSTAPWAAEHKLLHIGLKGRVIDHRALPPRNLVFLLDVSGSMNDPNKLPLLKRSLGLLLETMGKSDTVAIVVYAGASGMVLPPTSAHDRRSIERALLQLEAGGSTNGGEGIELAYRLAERSFRPGGVNRVILATDGDFNVGTTSQSELVRLIERKRDSGVFLTVLGFGMGNYKDSTLEKLADHGNGNYAYIDSIAEARKVLVQEGGANLVTIAKDVKIQVEMNPRVVGAYRLIGYENRVLNAEDFNDDKKDAGEIGAGHTVTALYEILSPEQARREIDVDALRYGSQNGGSWASASGGWDDAQAGHDQFVAPGGAQELATVKLRFKAPQGSRSSKIEYIIEDQVRAPSETSAVFRFSAAVASFGMLLRDSQHRGTSSFSMVERLAQGAIGQDEYGHRQEFLRLVERAARL